MKRRGGGGGGESQASRNVVQADVDDRQSDASRARAAQKAQAEARGTTSKPQAPLPLGLILGGVILLVVMLYVTIKFS